MAENSHDEEGGGAAPAETLTEAALTGAVARVYVLFTGGTFGMIPDATLPSRPLVPMDRATLAAALPKADSLVQGVKVTLDSLDRPIDSSSMRPHDWLEIARRIEKRYETHDGFVVIHGTDTLAYTSSALSFLFRNLAKPVVVTGAQYPLLADGSDAPGNYANALKIAGHKVSGLPCIPEVSVVFGTKILRGCRARKMRTDADSCFDSPNCPPLGMIDDRVHIYKDRLLAGTPDRRPLQVASALNPNVADIALHPGLGTAQLTHLLGMFDLRGVVLRVYGAGNAPAEADFVKALGAGLSRKIAVAITQCPYGGLEMGLYATSLGLMAAGAVAGADITPEAALAKMMVLLEGRPEEEVRHLMATSIRGEMTVPPHELPVWQAPEQTGTGKQAGQSAQAL